MWAVFTNIKKTSKAAERLYEALQEAADEEGPALKQRIRAKIGEALNAGEQLQAALGLKRGLYYFQATA